MEEARPPARTPVRGAPGGLASDDGALFGTLLKQSFDGVALTARTTGRLIEVNESLCTLTGYTREELLERRSDDLGLSEPDEAHDRTGKRPGRNGHGPHRRRLRRKDGQVRTVELSSSTLPGREDVLTVVRDVSDMTDRLDAEEEFRVLLESSPDAMVIIDRAARIMVVNAQTELLFGYARDRLIGQPVEVLMPERLRETHARHRSDYLTDPKLRPMGTGLELYGRHQDGHEFPVEISLTPLVRGGTIAVAGTIRDVTEQRHAEEARARLAAIVASSNDAIVGLSLDGTIESWNQGAERLYGYRTEEVLGRPADLLMEPGPASERMRMLDLVREGATFEETETEDVRKDGSVVAVEASLSPVRGHGDTVIGAARIARDITDRKRFEHELKFYADHDPLTGQYNRRRFAEELDRQHAFVARQREPTTVLIADLDRFKYINDTVGHRAGDQLISRVARLLRERLRESDVLARLGGDEFAVLLPGTDLEQGQVVAESLRTAVRGLTAAIGGRRLRCSISIGVAPLGTDPTGEDALARADMAMYEAKDQGRDRVAVASNDGDRGKFARHLHSAERLYEALERGGFELYAQPIYDLRTHQSHRNELLLRMRDEHRHLVLPATFIHSAERLGIIGEIDRWVAQEAVRLLADDPDRTSVYQINASGASITDPSLLSLIERELANASVDPSRLVIEVTETAAISDIGSAGDFIRGLTRIGCESALDDFGSGFASFTYLRHIPVQYLKIDGEFVGGLPGNESDRVLVKAIVEAAHGLGKRTIAEHVTSLECLSMLAEYGVEYAQGFFLGGPEPARARLLEN